MNASEKIIDQARYLVNEWLRSNEIKSNLTSDEHSVTLITKPKSNFQKIINKQPSANKKKDGFDIFSVEDCSPEVAERLQASLHENTETKVQWLLDKEKITKKVVSQMLHNSDLSENIKSRHAMLQKRREERRMKKMMMEKEEERREEIKIAALKLIEEEEKMRLRKLALEKEKLMMERQRIKKEKEDMRLKRLQVQREMENEKKKQKLSELLQLNYENNRKILKVSFTHWLKLTRQTQTLLNNYMQWYQQRLLKKCFYVWKEYKYDDDDDDDDDDDGGGGGGVNNDNDGGISNNNDGGGGGSDGYKKFIKVFDEKVDEMSDGNEYEKKINKADDGDKKKETTNEKENEGEEHENVSEIKMQINKVDCARGVTKNKRNINERIIKNNGDTKNKTNNKKNEDNNKKINHRNLNGNEAESKKKISAEGNEFKTFKNSFKEKENEEISECVNKKPKKLVNNENNNKNKNKGKNIIFKNQNMKKSTIEDNKEKSKKIDKLRIPHEIRNISSGSIRKQNKMAQKLSLGQCLISFERTNMEKEGKKMKYNKKITDNKNNNNNSILINGIKNSNRSSVFNSNRSYSYNKKSNLAKYRDHTSPHFTADDDSYYDDDDDNCEADYDDDDEGKDYDVDNGDDYGNGHDDGYDPDDGYKDEDGINSYNESHNEVGDDNDDDYDDNKDRKKKLFNGNICMEKVRKMLEKRREENDAMNGVLLWLQQQNNQQYNKPPHKKQQNKQIQQIKQTQHKQSKKQISRESFDNSNQNNDFMRCVSSRSYLGRNKSDGNVYGFNSLRRQHFASQKQHKHKQHVQQNQLTQSNLNMLKYNRNILVDNYNIYKPLLGFGDSDYRLKYNWCETKIDTQPKLKKVRQFESYDYEEDEEQEIDEEEEDEKKNEKLSSVINLVCNELKSVLSVKRQQNASKTAKTAFQHDRFVEDMYRRQKEREMKKRERKKLKQVEEDNKIAELSKVIEAEKLIQEMKRKQVKRIVIEKNKEKLRKKQEKKEKMERMKKLEEVAAGYRMNALMKYYGWIPWMKYLQGVRQMANDAEAFYRETLMRKFLGCWRGYTMEKCQQLGVLVNNHNRMRMLTKAWKAWNDYIASCRTKHQLACRYFEISLKRKTMQKWQIGIKELKYEKEQKHQLAKEFSNKRIMASAFHSWKRLPGLMVRERGKEERIDRMRRMVAFMLPDYQPQS